MGHSDKDDDSDDYAELDIIEQRERELRERQKERRKQQLLLQQQQKQSSGGGVAAAAKGTSKSKQKRTIRTSDDRRDSDDEWMEEEDNDDDRPRPNKVRQQGGSLKTGADDAVDLDPNELAAMEAAIENEQEKQEKSDAAATGGAAAGGVKAKRINVKLTIDRLLSSNGLPKLLEMAGKFSLPNASARPIEKLNKLMSLYEVWAHVMVPSMAFDDVITKLEQLGSKRLIQRYMHQLRLGKKPGEWDVDIPAVESASEDDGVDFEKIFDAVDAAEQENIAETAEVAKPVEVSVEEAYEFLRENAASSEGKRVAEVYLDEDLNDLDNFLDNIGEEIQPVRSHLL